MTIRWIDTHAHIDDEAFDHDRAEVLSRAAAVGVETVINVGYRPARWESTAQLARDFASVRVMLGVHPQHADEWSVTIRSALEAAIIATDAVAIGEIGFDFFRPGPTADQQLAAFSDQAALALARQLPIVIHQRAAEAELIAALHALPGEAQALLHSFEGTSALAAIARDRGFFVGVGGLATRSANAALRETLSMIPLAQVVLETDAPYLAPAGTKDRRNMPATIPLIAERLASLWNVDSAAFAAATTANAERFFGLSPTTGQRRPTGQNL